MTGIEYSDIFLSIGVGLVIGYIVGGFWNLMLGRTWQGKVKK